MKIALAVVLGLGALVGIAAIFPTGGECGGYGVGPFAGPVSETFVTFGGEPKGVDTIEEAGEGYLPEWISLPSTYEGRVIQGDYGVFIDEQLIAIARVHELPDGTFLAAGHLICLQNYESLTES